LICGSCEKKSGSGTVLQGTAVNVQDQSPIPFAFLILGEEWLAVTDAEGSFEITTLDPGTHTLICSAIDYGDDSVRITIDAGDVVSYDFQLSPDDSKGRIYGELHDQTLYDEQLKVNPSMAAWSGKELFDGVSGATIQTMTFGMDLPASEIYIGDSLLSLTDGFGQYWFDIQSGTYPLRISSPGYQDTMQIVRVEPDSRIYANFILSKK
jgi:hypothetical protein